MEDIDTLNETNINCTNVSDTFILEFEDILRHSYLLTTLLVTAYSIIFVVGFAGNSMVIYGVLRNRVMHSATNIFIMNLAIADWFIIVICGPTTLANASFHPWIPAVLFPNVWSLCLIFCNGFQLVTYTSVCVSAYSLAAMSIDRCVAFSRSMEVAAGLSTTQAKTTVALIWLTAITLSLPGATQYKLVQSPCDEEFQDCIDGWVENSKIFGEIYYIVVIVIIFYYIPLVMVFTTNFITWSKIREQEFAGNIMSITLSSTYRTRHPNRNAQKLLLIVTVKFFASWTPYYVLNVVKLLFNLDGLEMLSSFAVWSALTNSCINPILYGFFSRKYYEMFDSLLPAWVCRERSQENVPIPLENMQ